MVVDSSTFGWNGVQQTFGGGLLIAQAKAGNAQVSISLDGVVTTIFDVTVTEQAPETGTAVLGTYTPPQLPPSS